jgi:uncharacterized protein (DUF2336 family)
VPPIGRKSEDQHLSSSPTDILKVLEERARAAQEELAGSLDAGADVLHYIAQMGASATRQAVAANPAAAARTNRLLAEDADDDVRAELTRKIARLMPGLDSQENAHVRRLTLETLECLAVDRLPRVRALLAEQIKALDNVPKSVVLALARDSEESVFAPILEYSPLLSDADLLEIIATARVREALTATARRKFLSITVANAVAISLDNPAAATHLADPEANVRAETSDTSDYSSEGVAVAWKEGRLDDRFIEDAILAGRRETVICGVATLGRIPEETARRVLLSGSAKAITALVWRAGLSMRIAFKIQSHLLNLPPGDLLPARDGLDFPLSDEEMRWHLSYFGVKG